MVAIPYFNLLFLGLVGLASVAFLGRARPRGAAWVGGIGHLVLAGLTGAVPHEGVLRLAPAGALVVDATMDLRIGELVFRLLQVNQPLAALILGVTGVALVLMALSPAVDASFTVWAPVLAGAMVLLALLDAAPLEPALLYPVGLSGVLVLAAFGLQGNRVGGVQGPLRIFVLPLLAVPFFLLAAWYVEQLSLTPQVQEMAVAAGYLWTLGLLVLLAPVPLHGGQSALLAWVWSIPGTWLLLTYQLAVVSLFYQGETAFLFLLEVSTPLKLWLAVLGMVTAIWAGIAAAGTGHPARLVGYALLYEWGLLLLVMATPGPQSWPLVVFLLVSRAVSGFVAALGLSNLELGPGSGDEHLDGIGSRRPWSSAAVLMGGLGLAGFPLTAGFTGHWAALQSLATQDWRIAAVVLIAGAGVVFGFVRLARRLFGGQPAVLGWAVAREPLRASVAAGVVLVIAGGLALAPQLLSTPLTWALTAFGY